MFLTAGCHAQLILQYAFAFARMRSAYVQHHGRSKVKVELNDFTAGVASGTAHPSTCLVSLYFSVTCPGAVGKAHGIQNIHGLTGWLTAPCPCVIATGGASQDLKQILPTNLTAFS